MKKTKQNKEASSRLTRSGQPSRRMTYLLCLASMILLIITAFELPRVVLQLQDGRSMETAHYEQRSGLDYSGLNTDYEKDLVTRLNYFAEGCEENRDYYAAKTEYTLAEEEKNVILEEIRQNLLENEFYFYVPSEYNSLGYLIDCWQKELELKKKETYVIYDDEGTGADIICQYYWLTLNNDFDIYFLLDSEDYTVYYMEIMEKNVEEWHTLQLEEIDEYTAYLYWDYYCINDNDIDNEVMKENESYAVGYINWEQAANNFGQGAGKCTIPLNYSKGSLCFEITIVPIGGIRMGIREIMNLLPEEVTIHYYG